MKIFKTFLACVVLLAVSLTFSQDNPPDKTYKGGECTCTCEYCMEHHHEWGDNDYRYRTISDRDFYDLKELIAGRSFESTKIELAKSGIERNYFKVEQVRELLKMFTFESNKLELAKLAYTKTQDRNRYYKLYDVFTFESSISDMEDFIKGQKQ